MERSPSLHFDFGQVAGIKKLGKLAHQLGIHLHVTFTALALRHPRPL
jgi:hypothetical protein